MDLKKKKLSKLLFSLFTCNQFLSCLFTNFSFAIMRIEAYIHFGLLVFCIQKLFGKFFALLVQKCLSATLGLEDRTELGGLAIKITNGSTDWRMTMLSLLKFGSNNLLSDTPEVKWNCLNLIQFACWAAANCRRTEWCKQSAIWEFGIKICRSSSSAMPFEVLVSKQSRVCENTSYQLLQVGGSWP